MSIFVPLLVGDDIYKGLVSPPIDHRLKGHLDGEPFPLILIEEDVIDDAFFHGAIVVVNDLLEILMDDCLCELSVENRIVRNVFLVGLDLAEG